MALQVVTKNQLGDFTEKLLTNDKKIKDELKDVSDTVDEKLDKYDCGEEKNLNEESIWSVGIIDTNGENRDNPARLRTKELPLLDVISVSEGYEYAIVLYKEPTVLTSSGNGYLNADKTATTNAASYYTDATTVDQMLAAAPNAKYMRLLLRNKNNTNTAMDTSMYSNITIAPLLTGEKDNQAILKSFEYNKSGLSVANGVDKTNEAWTKYNNRLAFGMNTDTAKVPFWIDGQLFADGTIIARNSGTMDKNRWGFHVFEAYAKDNYSRMTMLLDKHPYENGKPSLEIYYYTGASHYDTSYGNTKIGSDVKYHSFMFNRDTMTAYGKIDCKMPITLARIDPTTDLDSTYSSVELADANYEPEGQAEENNKCLRYIALKNAENGAMFYDTNRNKVVVKVNGKWHDVQTSEVPNGTYNF